MPNTLAAAETIGWSFHLHTAARHPFARNALNIGRSPLFLRSMRIFGCIDIAWALPSQSDFFHPAPERPRSDLSVVTPAQMGRQQGHCPNGRVVTEFQRIAREFP